MGRSVDYLSRALGVIYFHLDPTNENGKISDEDEDGNGIEREPEDYDYESCWDDLYTNILYSLKAAYPSLEEVNGWDGRETKIFLENEHCEIGISEYCGLVSVSIRINENNYGNEHYGISENWVNKAWDNMVKVMRENTYHDNLVKQGSFSNGESVYARV